MAVGPRPGQAHKTTSLRVPAFARGALSILLGLFCLRGARQSILLPVLWTGISRLIRGITRTIAAVHHRPRPRAAGRSSSASSVLTFVAGIVLIGSPLASVAVLNLLGGRWPVVVGVMEIVTAFRFRLHAEQLPQAP